MSLSSRETDAPERDGAGRTSEKASLYILSTTGANREENSLLNFTVKPTGTESMSVYKDQIAFCTFKHDVDALNSVASSLSSLE